MINIKKPLAILALVYIFLEGCIEPYPAPISDDQVDFLVVSGSVDAVDGNARVALSRAIPLAKLSLNPPEQNAIVSLEDGNGNEYSLSENEPGIYLQSNLPITLTDKYRIRIKTQDENEYVSDFITPKSVPPIDSITWTATDNSDGIEISVTTHDDTGQTRYYQWSFEEVFQYNATYIVYYDIIGGEVVTVPEGLPIYECWKTRSSNEILIASSENLSKDIIYKRPINFLSKGSLDLSSRYSILVKQKSMSRKTYDYWLNLEQTTENLGGLYDPQPGQIFGNIMCINKPDLTVLGYFDVFASTQKRIFIDYQDLPNDLQVKPSRTDCEGDTVLIRDIPALNTNNYSIISEVYNGPSLIGYLYVKKVCTDCRLQNGVTTMPDFWE